MHTNTYALDCLQNALLVSGDRITFVVCISIIIIFVISSTKFLLRNLIIYNLLTFWSFYVKQIYNLLQNCINQSTCKRIVTMMTRKGKARLKRSQISTGLIVGVEGRELDTDR